MFKTQNFCHVASNNRNNVKAGVFIYKTNDNLQTVSASGYFNPRIIDINLHDLIIHEYIDPTDNTKVLRNVLCVTVKTLDNIETVVIKSNWQGDIEQEIADLRTYVNNNFVKTDGSSIMSGPLKFIAGSFTGAIAGGLGDGIAVYKINSSGTIQAEVASLTLTNGFVPGSTNTINIGSNALKWKNLYLSGTAYMTKINNGFDIAVPVTNSADTLALKSQVDDAANSGEQLYTTGVWYAKMYAATVVPTGAEYDGRNYADFSQVDNDNNPIVVIYEGQSGSWVEIARITPPANHVAYLTITSKIWDIAEQTDQQGGEILWSYNQKTFTPYPKIVSVAGFANTDLSNLTATGKANVSALGTYDPNETYNAGTVGEAITGKADKDASNFTATGQDNIVAMGRGFTALNTTVASSGGSGIAGTYQLGFTDNKVKLGLFSVESNCTQAGGTTVALATDVATYPCVVCGTNNRFTMRGCVMLPFINEITISFPETGGGVGSTGLYFRGWM